LREIRDLASLITRRSVSSTQWGLTRSFGQGNEVIFWILLLLPARERILERESATRTKI